MLSNPVQTHATSLFQASQDRSRIPALSQHELQMDFTDAYAIQAARNVLTLDAGAEVLGWKIGFSAKPVMALLGVEQPVYGLLTDDRVFEAGDAIPAGRLVAPRLEAEIAFVMETDLRGQGCTPADVVAATAYVSPAIELVDGRFLPADPATGATPTALDMIADNVAFGGLIMGQEQHSLDGLDLRRIGVIAGIDDEVEETGLGASVYGDPLAAMAWLANTLAEQGETIQAGQTVLSGSLVRHFACPRGTTAWADFGDFGRLEISFE